MSKAVVIILCAGKGERFGGKKQFFKLAGKPVFVHTIEEFLKSKLFDKVILVIRKEDLYIVKKFLYKFIDEKYKSKIVLIEGGDSRQESSRNAVLHLLSKGYDLNTKVLIHDAVRPFVNYRIIKNCLENIRDDQVVDVAVDAIDTIIKVDDNNYILEIPKRKYLKYGQTPQGFLLKHLKEMYEKIDNNKLKEFTDDCGIFVRIFPNKKIYVVNGDYSNIKITTPLDLYLADKIFLLKKEKFPKNLDSITKQKDLLKEKLKDKVIVIFGGSSGIGKSVYHIGRRLNLKIYATSRSNGVDIRNRASVKKFLHSIFSEEGRLDNIIVTAGILIKKPLLEMTYEEILEQIETNYIGCVNVIKESIPFLMKNNFKPKHIVLFSSSSYTRGRGEYSIYSSTKAAIVNLVQALSEEFEDICFNAIVPERTLTPMRTKWFGNENPDSLLKPETVAWYTLYLLTLNVTGLALDIRKNEVGI